MTPALTDVTDVDAYPDVDACPDVDAYPDVDALTALTALAPARHILRQATALLDALPPPTPDAPALPAPLRAHLRTVEATLAALAAALSHAADTTPATPAAPPGAVLGPEGHRPSAQGQRSPTLAHGHVNPQSCSRLSDAVT